MDLFYVQEEMHVDSAGKPDTCLAPIADFDGEFYNHFQL